MINFLITVRNKIRVVRRQMMSKRNTYLKDTRKKETHLKVGEKTAYGAI
jgi:hypothetical protein